MESFVRRFIRASLLWFGLGVLIGVSMAIWPMYATVYRPAHMHANLLGFVSMMIFGVAYHVIPRFTGNPLFSRRMAALHLWVANGGLLLMVGGWILRAHLPVVSGPALGIGATASAVGAFLFITNLWRTLEPRPAAAHAGAAGASARRPAPAGAASR